MNPMTRLRDVTKQNSHVIEENRHQNNGYINNEMFQYSLTASKG